MCDVTISLKLIDSVLTVSSKGLRRTRFLFQFFYCFVMLLYIAVLSIAYISWGMEVLVEIIRRSQWRLTVSRKTAQNLAARRKH